MFKIESIQDFTVFYDKVGQFFEEHYNTCEEYRANNYTLNIDAELMQSLIELGVMNLFVLKEDKETVGYINVSINNSPLFGRPQAVIDFLYILPEHRNKDYASTSIEDMESILKAEGVYDINIMLPNKDYSESVAKSLGYHKTSTVYTKYLGDK